MAGSLLSVRAAYLEHLRTNLSGAVGDNDTCSLESLDLIGSGALATSNDSTRMTHATSRRGRTTCDESDNRLGVLRCLVVPLKILGSLLLHGPTNFTNDNNTVGVGVLEEDLDDIDVLGAGEGVTTDSDAQGLTQADVSSLCDGLIGKGS